MATDERRAHLKRIASLGGQAAKAARQAAKEPLPPYGDPFLTFLDAVGRGGPSRAAWRAYWKAVDGLPLEPEELSLFRLHTGRTTPPATPAREVEGLCGRRSGKSEEHTARAVWRAISREWSAVLAAGERGIIPIIAPDKDQARNTLGYLKGIARHPTVTAYVSRVLKDAVEFRTGAVVRVATASYRAVRGFTFLDVILEESAFYRSEESANPDVELLHAVRPALLTIPDARIYAISSPYARSGILYDAWEKHWAKDGDVLVWNGDTVSMNPTVNAAEIHRAFEDDPAVAAAEYGRDGLVSFRADVQALLSREAVQAVVVAGRLELPRLSGVQYLGFVDPSGGSQDSMTLAIGHRERDGLAVLDAVREVRPPFSPESVVVEFCTLLKSYGLSRATGDRYGGEWPREQFRKHGVTYEPADKSKSEFYVELLPLVNGKRCALLDHPKLAAQLIGLERRTGRGTGRDSIDHAPGAHDDVANAVAGVLVLAGGKPSGARVMFWHEGMDGWFDSWTPKPDGPGKWTPPPELDENGN